MRIIFCDSDTVEVRECAMESLAVNIPDKLWQVIMRL